MYLIEGNIGAGKTTLGRAIAETALADFIEEPVDQWTKPARYGNMLGRFYNDQHRWAFTFQMLAFISRAKTWEEILAMTDHHNVFLERSIYCDRFVFAKNCYQSGLMDEAEWNIYRDMWAWLEARWADTPDAIIYLKTPAELCHERLKLRGRGEEQSVPLSYLKDLEVLHDEWLLETAPASRCGVYVVDGSQPIDLDLIMANLALMECNSE